LLLSFSFFWWFFSFWCLLLLLTLVSLRSFSFCDRFFFVIPFCWSSVYKFPCFFFFDLVFGFDITFLYQPFFRFPPFLFCFIFSWLMLASFGNYCLDSFVFLFLIDLFVWFFILLSTVFWFRLIIFFWYIFSFWCLLRLSTDFWLRKLFLLLLASFVNRLLASPCFLFLMYFLFCSLLFCQHF
jgi:hypothetical protein